MLYFLYVIYLMVSGYSKRRTVWRVTGIVFFVGIFGLSYANGSDWIGYFLNYDCLVNDICRTDLTSFEPGYNLYAKVIGGALGFQGLIFVGALFNVYAIDKFSRNFNNPQLAFLFLVGLFAWIIYIELARQSIAISIAMFSYAAIWQGKIFKSAFLFLLATLFHSSALILLFFVGLFYIPRRLYGFLTFFILTVSLLFVVAPEFVLTNVALILSYLSPIASEKILFYLTADSYKPQLSIGFGTISDIFISIVILYTIYRSNSNARYLRYVKMGCVLYICFILAAKVFPVISRLAYFFIPFVAIMVDSLYGKNKYVGDMNFRFGGRKMKFIKYAFFLYAFLQLAIRPMIYPYISDAILNYDNLVTKMSEVSDDSFRKRAVEKCLRLNELGYHDLCYF